MIVDGSVDSGVVGVVDPAAAGSGAVAGAGWATGSGGFGSPATGDEPGSTELAAGSAASGWSAAGSGCPPTLSIDGVVADGPDADGAVADAVTSVVDVADVVDVVDAVDVVEDRIEDADGAPPEGLPEPVAVASSGAMDPTLGESGSAPPGVEPAGFGPPAGAPVSVVGTWSAMADGDELAGCATSVMVSVAAAASRVADTVRNPSRIRR